MAKKEIDEFDFDNMSLDDFDTTGFEFDDPSNVKDDRKPATKIAAGALDSFKSTVVSPSYLGNVVKGALPKGYRNTLDVIDTVGSETYGLYNDAVHELRPVLRNLKRVGKILKPKLDPIIPKKLSEKLDNLLASDEKSAEQMKVDADEASLSSAMAEVFKAQADAQTEDKAEHQIQRVVDTKRAEANINILADIRKYASRQVSFQDSIYAGYLRKSLELKYRTFFATRDLLEVTKAYTSEAATLLKSINKNTGLPDFVKLKESEAFQQKMRDTLLGKVQGYVSNAAAPFIRQIGKNIRTGVKSKLQDFAQSAETAAMGAEQLQAGEEMAKEFGVDGATMAGNMVGTGLAGSLGDWVGKKLRPVLAKNKTIAGGGHLLERMSTDGVGMLQRWAMSPTMSFGLKGSILDFLKSSIPKTSNSATIADESLEDLKGVSYWSGQDSKTLQIVIPGLLARIHQSSEGIRTGSLPDLTSYDYRKSEFTTSGALKQRIKESVVDQSALRNIDFKTKGFMEALDPNGQLPQDLKDRLALKMLSEIGRNPSFDIKNYNNTDSYYGDFTPEEAETLAAAFKNKVKFTGNFKEDLQDVDSQRTYNILSNAYRDLKLEQDSSVTAAQQAGLLGNKEALRALGITTLRGNADVFNNSYLLDVYKDYLKNNRDYEKTINRGSSGSVPQQSVNPSGFSSRGPVGDTNYSTTATPFNSEEILEAVSKKPNPRMKDPIETDRFISQQYGAGYFRPSGKGYTPAFESRYNNGGADVENSFEDDPYINAIHDSADSRDVLLNQILDAINSLEIGSGEPVAKKGRLRGAIKRGGRSLLAGVKKYAKFAGRMQKAAFMAPWKLAKKAWDFGKRAVSFMKNLIQDVYVRGSELPKLTADKMRNGDYVDAITGKPIKSVKDIVGAVRDLVSGNVVLTAEEYASGLYNKDWKKIGKNGKDLLFSTGRKVAGFLFRQFTAPVRAVKSGYNYLRENFFAPKDVYVPGEKEPRLLGLLMLRGKYFSSKTGKPIHKIGDIDSDVRDENGNIKLTLEEFARGVVDSEGKPILTRTAKIKNFLTSAWGLGKKVAGWAKDKIVSGAKKAKDLALAGAGKVKKLATGLWDRVSGKKPIFGNFKAGVDLNIGIAKHQVENTNVLKRIYNLLRKQFNAEGEDLPLTEMPELGLGNSAKKGINRLKAGWRKARSGIKSGAARSRLEKIQRRVKAKGRLARMKLRQQAEKAKPHYKSWKDKLKEKMADVRKNGWRDILAKRKEAMKSGLRNVGGKILQKAAGGGTIGTILKVLLGIGGLIKMATSKITDMVKGFFSFGKVLKTFMTTKTAVGAAGDIAGAAGGAGVAKKGLLRRALGWGGKALKFAVGTPLAWAGRGLLAGGSAIIGAVSLPVALTVAAVAAVAVGGYYAYKYFKNKLQPLQKLRMTQYGLDPADHDSIVMTGQMECELQDSVEWAGGTATNIDVDKKFEGLLKIFGIASSDADAVSRFSGWFSNRFKPVFLTHMTLIHRYAPRAKIETIDDEMSNQFKSDYARASKYDDRSIDNPYQYLVHPLIGHRLVTGTGAIDAAIQDVIDEFDKYRGATKESADAMDQKKAGKYQDSRKLPSVVMGNTTLNQATAKAVNRHDVEIAKIQSPSSGTPTASVGSPAIPPSVSKALGVNNPIAEVKNGGLVSDYLKAKKRVDTDGFGVYSEIKKPVGTGYQALIGMLQQAADATGVHPSLLAALASAESSFNPTARAATSNAQGLFQFVPKTWRAMMEKYGERYGIPKNATPMDPVAASLLAGELTKENVNIMQTQTNQPIGPGEAYIGHFLGASEGSKLISADANANAAMMFPSAARSNASIFFNRDGSQRTVGEVRDILTKKVDPSKFDVTGATETAMIQDDTPPLTVDVKTPANVATVKKAVESSQNIARLRAAFGRTNYSTVPTETLNAKSDTMKMIQPRVLDIPTQQAVDAAKSKDKATATNDAGVTRLATLKAVDERRRLEREAQMSEQHSTIVGMFTDTNDLLSRQLSVQEGIRDDISRMVSILEKASGLSGSQPPVVPPSNRIGNPILNRKKQNTV